MQVRAQGDAWGRADLMTGRQRAAPALARSSGGSSVHRSLRGRHSRWFRNRMLLRSFSSHTFIMLELHIQSRVTCPICSMIL